MELVFKAAILASGMTFVLIAALVLYLAIAAFVTLVLLWHVARSVFDFLKTGHIVLAFWMCVVAPGIAVACLLGGWVPVLLFYIQGRRERTVSAVSSRSLPAAPESSLPIGPA